MTEQTRELRLSHADITGVFTSLLAMPRSHKALHPSQQRSRYAELREWLQKAMMEVVRSPQGQGKAVCEQQQRVMVSLLQELAQLGRKECAQKGTLLEIVREYLISTLNAYWTALQNANREVWYQFQHNSVRVQRQYIADLKRLQAENQQLKKDKDHRWRNMFMLIKDNRIHRRQNRKLLISISYQMQKNVALAQQMILLREQNQKLKLKLACFQNDPIRIQSFAQTHLKLLQLQESIRSYPKRSKKILKNDLVKIQIQQINNLNDKIKFIIKAIQQTGEIIDQFYDQETIWSNFQYNISTQTQSTSDDKATNTPSIRMVHAQSAVTIVELSKFQIIQTYNLIIRGIKKERKETRERQSKMPLLSATFSAGTRFSSRREDIEKVREFSSKQRMADTQFSICQSVKMTIHNGRIIYISTYNTEIFNGSDILRRIEEKIQTDRAACKEEEGEDDEDEGEKVVGDKVEAEVQTDPLQERPLRTNQSKRTKMTANLPLFSSLSQEQEKRKKGALLQLTIMDEVNIQYNPSKNRSQHHKLKFSGNNAQKQVALLGKTNLSDKALQSSRNNVTRNNKRLNSLQRFYGQDGIIGRKISKSAQKIVDKNDYCTQTDEKGLLPKVKNQLLSITNLDSKDQHPSITITNQTNTTLNSSFAQDLKQLRKNAKNKVFNQSADSFILSKSKAKPNRRSEMSPLKNLQQQPKKMQKISRTQLLKHKRTSTQNNENENMSESNLKLNRQFRMKPLHRISEVLTEADVTRQDNPLPTRDKGLPLAISRQGEIRATDFAKGVQKILKSMDIRRNEIISNSYTLKTYLSSYFKCLYGRQIYVNFLQFLSTSQPQEATICFSRLANPKAPQPYLVDIFKAFVKAINKCYVLGESPCSNRLRQEVLKYLAGLFLEDDQINTFALKMRNRGCYTLMGWFNCLEQEVRTETIHSQLYSLLSLWLGDATDSLTYQFIEEISYFMQTDSQTHKYLMKCKFFLANQVPLHRFCLFSYRFLWSRMLNLQTSIEQEYVKRLGIYNHDKSINRIDQYRTILLQFKNLQKCYKYWSLISDRYGSKVNKYLVMLVQLSIQEYRLKNQMPLSRELKYLNLVFEGLQKKKQFEGLKVKMDGGNKDNILGSKTTL